jgi:hypothetical protein
MEGTFAGPKPSGAGKTIKPPVRKINLRMATIAHWRDDRIYEEYLFWDNEAFKKQLGLIK